MRTLIVVILALGTMTACSGQTSKAVKDQQQVFAELEEMKAKGLMPAAEGGPFMTCLIDGKEWKATGLYPINFSERICGKYKSGYISFPVPDLRPGNKHPLNDHWVVDFSPADDPGIWDGKVGEIEITKIADGWVEGTFHFTATGLKEDQKMVITNGFFRVAEKKPK
jgi:hypothetical protein